MNPCIFGCAVNTSTVPCSLLELHQFQSIMFGHLYHMIDVPMNSVGGLIEDDKSAVASVVCVLAPVCNRLGL